MRAVRRRPTFLTICKLGRRGLIMSNSQPATYPTLAEVHGDRWPHVTPARDSWVFATVTIHFAGRHSVRM